MVASLQQWFKAWNAWLSSPSKLLKDRETFFKRYLYRNYHTFASITHRFHRRITLGGWMVLGGTVAAAALGADTNASLCYQTFALLICVIVISAACTPFGRPRLSLQRILPRFGAAGEPLRYRVRVRNESLRRENSLLLIEELPDPRPTFREFASTPEPGEERRNWLDRTYGYYRWRWLMGRNRHAQIQEQAVPDLPGGTECWIEAELTPLRRGVLRLTGTTVACPDPFGLFRSLRKIPARQSVLILPKRYPMPPFDLPGSMKYQLGGVSLASSVGESEEFVALREYRAGDPLRRMHWKSFAKLGKPIIKEYQDEFFVRHALILATFGGPMDGEIFEGAVSIAASLAYTVQSQDSLLDLMFIGPEAYCITSGRGVGHIDKVLEVLASVPLCQEKEFATLEGLVFSHAADLTGCLCVFLGWDEPRQRLVKQLLARGVPLRVFVLTVGDVAVAPGPMQTQPDNFHVLPVGRLAEKLAAL
jgi:uncharacterized protein (DUF58 family)